MHTFTTPSVAPGPSPSRRRHPPRAALLDINLLDAIEGKLLERLVTDPVLLCDILFALVQPEAQAKNITDEDFGKSLGGDVLDHATSALLEELVDFFPSARRTVFRKALVKLKRLEGMAIETATQRLESDELERKMMASLESGVRSLEPAKAGSLLLQTPVSGLQTLSGV
ncbi:MAG: hypothetical protein HC794_06780 [Nitrospiraceae bacterium]|nr:hypothetical protein [Nitrospiraceae bacterium]